MNEPLPHSNPAHPPEPPQPDGLERKIQRLVDGELPEAEAPAVLEALEQSTDGWRRCALAFIEAQRWNDVIGAMPMTLHAEAAPEAPGPRAAGRRSRDRRLLRLADLAVAAALAMLAFSIGLRWSGPPDLATPASPPSSTIDQAMAAKTTPGQELGSVRLQLSGSDNNSVFRLPVFSGTPEQRLLQPSELPPGLLGQLSDAGIDVTRTVSFQSVPVGDAGVIHIPVEHFDFEQRPRIIP